jgi:Carboxypeptidase regulatory-like domain
MQATRLRSFVGVLLFAFAVLLGARVYAGVTASISGTVTDASGAAIAGATVTATNVDTSVAVTQTTNAQGYYSFQSLPLGKYNIQVQQAGFKSYRQLGAVLEVNAALVVDVSLQVGQKTETVEVESSALHVETSSTQMGEVIEGKEMTDVPLLTRSYTDLLALQPGVVQTPSGMTGAYAGSFISAGFALPQISGDQNSGAQSVNGMREAANGFILNGLLAQESGFSGAGAIPNLDSIAEFRILTNNFDAEYGNYSGGQINVVTKSGSNNFHGNLFEFFRNTDLNTANFFNAGQRGAYHQNQFGGTIGGPIIKDKLFFFADYQGNRKVVGETQVISGAPSEDVLGGDFSSIAAAGGFARSAVVPTFNNGQAIPVPTTVNGDAWATQVAGITGNPVTNGLPYYYRATDYTPSSVAAGTPMQYGSACTTAAECVFPTLTLNPANFNSISSKLLPFILPANNANGTFSTSAQKLDLNDNKFSVRGDYNSPYGLLSAYYYFDKFDRVDPYWASNAPLYPGFSVDSNGHTQTIDLGSTKTFSSASVNEFRLGYFRLDAKFNQPLGGTGTTLASLGFAAGGSPGAPGITVGAPTVEGIPEIDFNNWVIGVPSRPNRITENIYQALDNYSVVHGKHTLKFGGQYHFNQLEENLFNVANGNFFFGSNFSGQPSETGSDLVDFLLGAPSQYVQGQSYPSYGRNFYFGLFGQDSWRIKSNLTFNFGLRYDVSAPWHEKYNEIQTLIPGEQSLVFPGSPLGWVFPGDPGVPRGLAPTRWNNFAPRLGLAYSFGDHDGALGKVLGKPGTTSIRAGWGMFYTSFEGATDFNEIGDAPFGNYSGQNQPGFASPFIQRASGSLVQNPFPVAPPPKNFSIGNPGTGYPYDNLVDFFSAFGTIGSSPAFNNNNKLPYAENYEFSIQRQFTTSDLLTVSYVGTQGHRLLSSISANPGIPSLCLSLNNPSAVMLNTPTCGPGGENNVYVLPDGTQVAGTRGPFSTPYRNNPVFIGGTAIVPFGNDSYFATIGNSVYNSLQVNWRHTAKDLQVLLGYTFSKSLDDSSGYGEQINPYNPRLSRGLSAFDSTNNFVVSYNYRLPFDKIDKAKLLTHGWEISGITTFSTGLPITVVETDDHALTGTGFGGPIVLPVDTPDYNGQSLGITNPRNNPNHFFFNISDFSQSAIGLEGTANRRFFHGPGLNNWNMAIKKITPIHEAMSLEFRAELFNMWNHAQFINPSGLVPGPLGTPDSPLTNFGEVTAARDPRLAQLGLKLNF